MSITSETDNTCALVGGVMALAIVVITGVAVVVVILLVLKIQHKNSPHTQ